MGVNNILIVKEDLKLDRPEIHKLHDMGRKRIAPPISTVSLYIISLEEFEQGQ
jgi:hypothetical protein